MGTTFRVVLFADDRAAAAEAAGAAFARVDELDSILSDWERESELNRLAAASGVFHPSADLWTVLVRAQEITGLTEGAFDVTVGPLVELWRRARRQERRAPVRSGPCRPRPEGRGVALKQGLGRSWSRRP